MKEIKKRGKKGHTHGPFYESDIRVLDKQGSWLGERSEALKGRKRIAKTQNIRFTGCFANIYIIQFIVRYIHMYIYICMYAFMYIMKHTIIHTQYRIIKFFTNTHRMKSSKYIYIMMCGQPHLSSWKE